MTKWVAVFQIVIEPAVVVVGLELEFGVGLAVRFLYNMHLIEIQGE